MFLALLIFLIFTERTLQRSKWGSRSNFIYSSMRLRDLSVRFEVSASSSKENFDHTIRWMMFSEKPYGQSFNRIFMSPMTMRQLVSNNVQGRSRARRVFFFWDDHSRFIYHIISNLSWKHTRNSKRKPSRSTPVIITIVIFSSPAQLHRQDIRIKISILLLYLRAILPIPLYLRRRTSEQIDSADAFYHTLSS